MDRLRRIVRALRHGRGEARDPAARLRAARWQRRAMAADVRRDLDDLADERTHVEAEIAHGRATVVQLAADAASATADGCADVAAQFREEQWQTEALLAELAEERQAIAVAEGRLLRLREQLADQVADQPADQSSGQPAAWSSDLPADRSADRPADQPADHDTPSRPRSTEAPTAPSAPTTPASPTPPTPGSNGPAATGTSSTGAGTAARQA